MLNKEAIEKLQEAVAIEQAKRAVAEAMAHDHTRPVAIPGSMSLHDLQNHMPHRRRLAGVMHTGNLDHFANYAKRHAEANPAVFVDEESMSATGVLNFGDVKQPGHADNLVTLRMVETAPYKALLRCVNSSNISQRAMAEWMEDNMPHIRCYHDATEIKTGMAIAAIRNVTVEQINKVESTVESLSQERSAFEQIKATSKHVLPNIIYFDCEPYIGLPQRTFSCRFGIHSSGDGMRLALSIINHEWHRAEMAQQAVELLSDKLGSDYPLYVGTYQKA